MEKLIEEFGIKKPKLMDFYIEKERIFTFGSRWQSA